MNTYTLTSTVEIEPQYLHTGLLDIIIIKLNEKYLGKCTQKHGYVNSINDVKILSNKMSRVSLTIQFTVSFNIECFNPQEGKEIEMKAKLIMEYGIMGEEHGVRILIPKTSFEGIIKDGILKLKDREIKKNDVIKVKIINSKYEKKNFSVIANLI